MSSDGMNNPIYVEYYSHLGSDCYKVNIPWSKYRSYKVVLCTVGEGLEKAKELAKKVIKEALDTALEAEIVKE